MQNYIGKNCKINGKLIDSCLGENVEIGKNSELNSTIVYDDTIIEDNVIIKKSVIGEGCLIEKASLIVDTVVGDGESIQTNSKLKNHLRWTQAVPEGYPKKQIGNVIGEI
jgi:NDP-sugar pyrophosphorylase family protein